MQKKSKTILTAVVTALFVLSLGYFALLAPTTAWYYQSEDKDLSFSFGNFNMGAPSVESAEESLSVRLRGTTRFADKGETLFKEMVHVVKVTASNAAGSSMSGRVGVKVKQGNAELTVDDDSGLKWFIFEDPEITTAAAAKEAVKGKISDMLEAKNSDWPINYKGEDEKLNTFTGTTREDKYESYNAQAIKVLKTHNDKGISVAPGASKTMFIVFWAEYGDLKGEFEVASEPAERTIVKKTYGVASGSDPVTYTGLSIEVYAMPDTGGTQTQTLTISGATETVNLYQWDDEEWVLYTGTGSNNGAITTPGTITLPVGEPFRLVIPNTQSTVRFEGGNGFMQTDDTGRVIEGTMSNTSVTVTLTSRTPTLVVSNKAASAASVKVYTWASGAWTELSGGVSPLSVSANGSASVELAAGTRYKLEITGEQASTCHFNNSSMATQIIGTVSAVTNTVTIVPNPS